MTIRFLRVVGVRARRPQVLASVDGAWVEWNRARGWTCTCTAPDGAGCPHVDGVITLLDPRVLSTPKNRPSHEGAPA